MGSKIQSFQSTFNKGIARPNLFSVEFPRTPGGIAYNNDEMELRVQSVTMPGKNITTTPNDNAYGPSYEMANGISYAEEIAVTYILDQDHRAREFWNTWQDVVVNPSTYDLNYYDDYIGTMVIYQLDQNDQIASAIQINEVFPKSVSPVEYSMESGSSILTVTVNIAFKNWTPLVTNFAGQSVANWIDDSNASVPNRVGLALSELYKLQSKFGIPLPAGATAALNRIQAFSNFGNNPMNFLKRTVAQKISGKIGGFRPFGL